ncbi:Uncharacterised protein [Vibrio cholerae]|nr:Uncharacterised protein [Vibrio cholerae]
MRVVTTESNQRFRRCLRLLSRERFGQFFKPLEHEQGALMKVIEKDSQFFAFN